MNNQIITLSIISFLVYLVSFLYSYYGLYLQYEDFKTGLKCLPAAILAFYSFVLVCYYEINVNIYAKKMSICLTLIYVLCIIGDTLLLFKDTIFIAVGGIFFMVAYLILGFMNYFKISKNTILNSRRKLYANVCIFIYFIIYIFISVIVNAKIHDNILISLVLAYLMVVLISTSLVTYKFIACKNSQFLYFLIGTLFLAVSDILLILNMTFLHKLYFDIITINIYWSGLLFIVYATNFFDEPIMYSTIYPPYINI